MAENTAGNAHGGELSGADGHAENRHWPVHPACELLPAMGEQEFADLVQDIAAHGLREKVVVWRSSADERFMLLDGRHRLQALEQLGIELSVPAHVTYLTEPLDPWAFVVSKNLRRRHLTKQQAAEVVLRAAAAAVEYSATVAGKSVGRPVDQVLRSAVEMGRPLGISRRTIERAREPHTFLVLARCSDADDQLLLADHLRQQGRHVRTYERRVPRAAV